MIENPNFKIKDKENNIFTIREREYNDLENQVRKILEPTKDLGFNIKELGFKSSKFSKNDAFKTIKRKLVIKLEKETSEINLSLDIPKLVNRNYIVINGRKKLPQYQLFDIPIVTRGKSIKMRTNVATIFMLQTKTSPYLHVTILGKKVPFSILLFAYYSPVELSKLLNKYSSESPLFLDLFKDIKYCSEKFKKYNQDNFVRHIGELYSKYNAKSKGETLMYALDLIPKVDIASSRFFNTSSVLEEFLLAIGNPDMYDDTDYTNKRIRCFEYLVLSKVSKSVFDLCISNRTAKQPKFNVNSTQVLTDCNVSDIIQFDFSINPIEELTMLSRTSLVGPSGFSRANVPEHLRDITSSMFGRICPVDTPDRDNCGVLQNLLPNTKMDKNLRFTKETTTNQPVSIPVSMVPFLEHDDQTRLQMSSSQMRQSIMLKKFEQPLIRSGCEGLYTEYTQFVKKAKRNGEVVFSNEDYIIVRYDNSAIDMINVTYRNIYVENIDVLNVYVKAGDKFKKGDILAESSFCKDGNINIGKNLLTGVMIYFGKNYEDGIVISERLVNEGVLTSIHSVDLSFVIPPNKILRTLSDTEYKPLPNQNEMLDPSQQYAILKEIPFNVMLDNLSIFKDDVILTTKKQTKIMKVEVYANTWNKNIPEFDQWVKKKIESQRNQEINFENVLHNYFPEKEVKQIIADNNLDKFSNAGDYKYKNQPVNGIRIELHGTYIRPIQVGDKMGNRHGNKGVIAAIVPEKKMPKLETGEHLDICINPLGMISRMNIGQLFELHLSMSLQDLKKKLLVMLDNNVKQEEIRKYLLDYIKIVDGTSGWYYNQFERDLPKVIDKVFVKNLTLIQAPFESCNYDKLLEALNYTDTKYEYELYEPMLKRNILNKIAVGYIYFFRMVHIAESRLAARGIGSYNRRTLQPLSGRKNKGGQRMGEMETACYIGHDAPINLHECLTTKSDCIDLKDSYIQQEIGSYNYNESITESDLDEVPESVKLLSAYLKVIGIEKD